MKSATAQAKAMTNEQLQVLDKSMRREIPRAQSLHDAVKREIRGRARKAKKAA